jgi:hypothetical protein
MAVYKRKIGCTEFFVVIQGVSGGRVNILGGGSMDYFE